MCVIVVKPRGIDLPPISKLRDCFTANKDGAGFMVSRDNKVLIRKGFMKFKHLLKSHMEMGLGKDDTVIWHFRIATAGSVSPANCHPFPLSSNVQELRQLSIDTPVAVAHNGMLHDIQADKAHDLSDTMTFIRDILSRDTIRYNIMTYEIYSLIELAVGANRLVFLQGDGTYCLVGDWYADKADDDGCYYSNLYFKRVSKPPVVTRIDGPATGVTTPSQLQFDTLLPAGETKRKRCWKCNATQIYSSEFCDVCGARYGYGGHEEKSTCGTEDTADKEFAYGANDVFQVEDTATKCPKCSYDIYPMTQERCSKCGSWLLIDTIDYSSAYGSI